MNSDAPPITFCDGRRIIPSRNVIAVRESESESCPLTVTGPSDADPADFVRALANGEGFGPDAVNAADQWADPGSLLNAVRALVSLRRTNPEVGRGETRILSPDEGGTGPLVLESAWRGSRTVTVHNLSTETLHWRVEGVESPLCRHLASDGVEAARELSDGTEIALPPRGWLWARSEA